METPVQLVYRGEILDGFALDDVKRALGAMFRLEGDRLALLFSGSRVVVKRSLGSTEARRLVEQLAGVGARLRVEPAAAAPAPAVAPATPPAAVPTGESPMAALMARAGIATPTAAPTTPSAASAAPTAFGLAEEAGETIVCPTCGLSQTRRILCRGCATDMPMGIAAKLEAEQEARAQRLAERHGRRAPATASSWSGTSDDVGLWGFGFDGRLGRLSYATACVWLYLALLVSLIPLALRPSASTAALFGLGLLAVLFQSVRTTVLRWHDLGHGGWWSLLLFVPGVGSLVGLAMLFVPGHRDDNEFGGVPGRGGWVWLLIGGAVAVLALGYMARLAPQAQARASQASEQMVGAGAAGLPRGLPAQAIATYRGEYASAPTHKAFASAPSGAWGWASAAASAEAAASEAVARCEEHRKPYTPACEAFDVDGF